MTNHSKSHLLPEYENRHNDLIWGADNIARTINRSERQTFHMLSGGHIPPAVKVGNRWVVSRAALTAFFRGLHA